jgi:hypothetical protein
MHRLLRSRASSRRSFRRVTWSTAENRSSRSNTLGSPASARDGDALFLSAGERRRPAIIELLEPDERQQLTWPSGALPLRKMVTKTPYDPRSAEIGALAEEIRGALLAFDPRLERQQSSPIR